MKKTLLIAALSMAATPALASKARLSALGNGEHLSDVQRTFDRPYQAAMHGEYATVEFGSNGGTPNAEGGFTRQVSEGNYLGFYVNRRPAALVETVNTVTDLAGGAAEAFPLDNGLNVFYGSRSGDMTWGANLYYLSANKKSTAEFSDPADGTALNRKADVMGVSLGASTDMWEVDAVIGLAGKTSYEIGTAGGDVIGTAGVTEIQSTSNYTLRGAYKMDNMYYFARYNMGGAKIVTDGTDALKTDRTQIELGLVNTMRSEGTEFFYGVSYLMTNTKNTDEAGLGVLGGDEQKVDETALPLVVGVEADANSWMVLRGSIRHNLPFLSTTKTTVDGTGEADTLGGSTVVAAGAGFKFNRFTVDTLIAAASDGEIGFDGGNFLTNASLTYSF